MRSLDRLALAGLSWPIKQSFAQYVAASPAGAISIGDGAEVLPEWDLVFAPRINRSDPDTGDGEIGFSGSVRYTAHFGALDVTVRDPWIRIVDGAGTLHVTGPDGRLCLATIECAYSRGLDGSAVWQSRSVALSMEGVTMLGDVYAKGTQLDPFCASVIPHGAGGGR